MLSRQVCRKLWRVGILRRLGNTEETLSHRVRFKQISHGMKEAGADQWKIALFGELTIAVHELNVLLAKSFYPGQ